VLLKPAHAVCQGRSTEGHRHLGPGAHCAWRMVGLLAVSQTVGYGVLFYSFSVFLTPMAASLHANTAAVTGALTVSLLAAAATAIPVGRWLDRRGGRALMTVGSLLATLLVLAWSQVHNTAQLYAVWIGIGIGSAAVLYEAAFAVVVSWFDSPRRGGALLAVTVVAGFASSVFLPLAGWLNDAYGWRTAVLILAGVHGALTVPLHAMLRRPDYVSTPTAVTALPAATNRSVLIHGALRDPVYWLLGCGFVAQAVAVATVSVLLVTVLRALGHSPGFAATVAGFLGVLSVTGRLATTAIGRRWSTAAVTAVVFVLQGAGAVLLGILGHGAVGAAGCVLAFGLGFGVSTIARPALLADRYGTSAYATLSATWAMPLTLVKALAPLGAILLWHIAGLGMLLDMVAACCVLGAVSLGAAQRVSVRSQR
jgi:predicted MFS family arabinose efflux permease